MSRKITIAVLAGVAAACVATGASAAGRGGGGGGGGGGFHGGGGGGGFHGGGGGGGGGGYHGFAARSVSPSFAGQAVAAHSFAYRAFSGHGFAGRTFVPRSVPVRSFAAYGNASRFAAGRGTANIRHEIAVPSQFSTASRASTPVQLAHNQAAAQNFHGLHTFNSAGFNRNAFGNEHAWNHWGGRFWGVGWHRWGGGWGGWAGPVFWPYLYGDIFSFAFWPYDYYDPFWAFGPDFVLVSIFAPGPYGAPEPGPPPVPGSASAVYYGTNKPDRAGDAETLAAAAESCGGLAPGVAGLPIAEIRSTVHPTGEQTTALDELNAAAAKANGMVKASCPPAIPLTPVARLDAAEARLETMIQAVEIVRGPLEKFYDLLSAEQKQRFDAMGNNPRGATPPGADLAALCSQQTGDVTKLPVQRIEQVVQPNAQQQEAFDALKKTAEETGGEMQASCPAQMPQGPVARLDAVKTRLTVIVAAMQAVRPKLVDFYASLSDEQKARFNTMGPPQDSADQHQSNDR